MMDDLGLALFALVLLGLGYRSLRGARVLLLAIFFLSSSHAVLVQNFPAPSADCKQHIVFTKKMLAIQCDMQ
jgi:hypothetical protein